MRLVGKDKLSAIRNVNNDIDIWLSAWVAELSNANWRSEADLINAFPRVSLLSQLNSYAFPIFGNDQISIEVTFCFIGGIAVIREVVDK